MIGPNGAGKTTLFRMIVGQEQPDGGALRVGETVELAYVDQSRDALDPDKTVWEEISGGDDQIKVGEREMTSRAYVAGFNFRGSDQQKKVGKLSGGERNRVHLAKLLRRGGNLLLLDEPTNDLDVDTLRALEEALLASPAARWSSRTTAGSSTASRPTCSPSRATPRSSGSRATSRPTRSAPRAARRRGRPAAPDHLQEAHARVIDRDKGERRRSATTRCSPTARWSWSGSCTRSWTAAAASYSTSVTSARPSSTPAARSTSSRRRRTGRSRPSPTRSRTGASRSPGRLTARWSSTRSTPARAGSWPTSRTRTRRRGRTWSVARST